MEKQKMAKQKSVQSTVFASLIIFLFMTSCHRMAKETTTSLHIHFPDNYLASKVQKTSPIALRTEGEGSSFNSELSPTDIAQINCYAVFVGGPEPALRINSCSQSHTSTEKMRFGPFAGFFNPGEEMRLEAPSGPDREIYVIGLVAQSNACRSFQSSGPDKDNLSYPHIIGFLKTQLNPGLQDISMSVRLKEEDYFDSCSFFSGGSSGNAPVTPPPPPTSSTPPLFGDGRDGSLVIASTISPDADTLSYNNGSLVYTPATANPQPSTKKFTAYRRIIAIDSNDRKTLTLSSSIDTVNEFSIGDEVAWHVAAGHASVSPDTNACGGGLARGDWGTSKIVSIPSSTELVLETAVGDPLIPLAAPSNFSATAMDGTVPFCLIQLVRIPNLLSLQVSSSTTLRPPAFSWTNGYGGLLIFRTQQLVLPEDLLLTAQGRGFPSASGLQGSGVSGYGSSTTVTRNLNGGGYENTGMGSGGGGSAGPGGGGMASPHAQGGSAIDFCSGPCLISQNKKIFFGGSAGAGMSGAGGNGGGAIVVFAQEISGTDFLIINSGGADSSTMDAGGGGGGASSITVKNMLIPHNQFSMDSKGGDGDTDGGSGGGGVADLALCESTSATTTTHLNGVVSIIGGSSGLAGGDGAKLVHDVPALCTANY